MLLKSRLVLRCHGYEQQKHNIVWTKWKAPTPLDLCLESYFLLLYTSDEKRAAKII